MLVSKWMAIVLGVGLAIAAVVVPRERLAADVGRTVRAERAAIERVVVASGTIEPDELVEVRSKASGVLRRFTADAGDRVVAGQVIAELDRDLPQAAIREARAALAAAEAMARAATLARDQVDAEVERRVGTFGQAGDAKTLLERAHSEVLVAEARVIHARETLARLERELRWSTLTAPIGGVVLERPLNAGAPIASLASPGGGSIVMTIADTTRLHVRGLVDENDVGRLRVGLDARIRMDAVPDRVFPGRVRKIAPMGIRRHNATSFVVEVAILAGVEAIAPRLSADAEIVTEVHGDAVVVPEAALLYDGDAVALEVVAPDGGAAPVRRRVRVGIADEERVEITDGLAAGETVRLQ